MTPLYIFLDEGGNFDFAQTGTKYFMLTALTTTRSFPWEADLAGIKYDLIEQGIDIEQFHATEDKQTTRNRVFAAFLPYLSRVRLDALIVEKSKTRPSLQSEALLLSLKSDRPDYPCGRTPWVLIIGAEPL